ncbi:MAG: NB-ARC domain-containing protein [Actinomycetota bacterium]
MAAAAAAVAPADTAHAVDVGSFGSSDGPVDHNVADPPARSAVRAVGAVRAAAGAPPTGTVTFGFCDVVDGATLWAADDAETAAVAARLDALIRDAAEDHRGFVFSVAGDSVGVAFHRATDGLGWAEAVQQAMADLPAGGPAGDVTVRIGLHTGETESREGGYLGPAVSLASRLASIGHGGQVLISGPTAELLPEVTLTDLGRFRVEGTVADQRIVQLGDHRFPPLQSEGNRRGNLSRRSSRLIGRQDQLTSVVAALETHPLVTLVGPGGIGKTSLAVAVAQLTERRYGAVWVVALAGIDSSDDVSRAVADTLNINDLADTSVEDAIFSALRNRRVLLVLDNCEHVVDGAADLADLITATCDDVRLLATSREGLGVPNERLVPVAPLDPANAAVELFTERATAVNPEFEVDAYRRQVEEICSRLDGVPLAIELAAARTTTLTPDDLVDRLDDRFRLLAGGRRATMERHRTLWATIQWSYDLLGPAERELFQQLSVFTGPFDLDAVNAVALIEEDPDRSGAGPAGPDSLTTDDLLAALIDQSMVVAEPGTFGRRFRMLEAMRDFGGEHLQGSGDTDRVAERHAAWCADRVVAIRDLLAGLQESEGVARLNELWPNLRAAFGWAVTTGDGQLARRLLEPIATEIYVRNRNEIGLWALRLLEITPAEDRELVGFSLVWSARRYMRNEDPAGLDALIAEHGPCDEPMLAYADAFVHRDLDARVTIARDVVDQLVAAGDDYGADLFRIVGLGMSLLLSGRFDEGEELLRPLVDRHRVAGPPTCLNWALIYLGLILEFQGRNEEARQLYDESAAVDLPPKTQTWNRALDARAAFRRGSRAEAFELLGRSADELLEAEDIHGARRLYIEYVEMMVQAGNVGEAAEVVGFLRNGGLLDEQPLSHRFAEAVELAEAYDRSTGGAPVGRLPPAPDDRAVLAHISTVTRRLVDDAPATG